MRGALCWFQLCPHSVCAHSVTSAGRHRWTHICTAVFVRTLAEIIHSLTFHHILNLDVKSETWTQKQKRNDQNVHTHIVSSSNRSIHTHTHTDRDSEEVTLMWGYTTSCYIRNRHCVHSDAPAAPSYLFKWEETAALCVCACVEEKLRDREGRSVVEEDQATENTTQQRFPCDLNGCAAPVLYQFFSTVEWFSFWIPVLLWYLWAHSCISRLPIGHNGQGCLLIIIYFALSAPQRWGNRDREAAAITDHGLILEVVFHQR